MANFSSVLEAFSISHAQILSGTQTFLEAVASATIDAEDIYGVSESTLEPDLDSYENEGDDSILSVWDWINKADLTVQAGYLSFPLVSSLTGRPVETLSNLPAVNAVQTLSSNGGATAGSFTLTYGGQTTGALQYNATAAAVTTALAALSSIGAGNVTVTGGPANSSALVITFQGALAGRPVGPVAVGTNSLTGGVAPTVSQTTAGRAATPGGHGIDLWHEDSMNLPPKPMIIKMPSKDKHGNPADFVIGLYKVAFKPIQFEGPSYKEGLKVNYDGTALASDVDEKGAPFPDGKKKFGRLLAILR